MIISLFQRKPLNLYANMNKTDESYYVSSIKLLYQTKKNVVQGCLVYMIDKQCVKWV